MRAARVHRIQTRTKSCRPGGKRVDGGTRRKGGPTSFFRENPVLYIWRLAQAITIDNRPIGTTAPRGSTIPPHFRESIGSMTNNSHNGPSPTPAPGRHASCSSRPLSTPSCYTRPDRFRQFYIHVTGPLIYYNVCRSPGPPSSLRHPLPLLPRRRPSVRSVNWENTLRGMNCRWHEWLFRN